MKNLFQICDRCNAIQNEDIVYMKISYSDCSIQVGCCNLCGIGRSKPFVIYNHIPIIADTFEEVIKILEERRKS